ncbi:unnamed protein product [Lactuca virosa]|uniref:Protein kinase domain-containing protein n=1 Tax=Lactuca virosa TaxID=75947 RepID=A0AAU9PIE0_9ASTR|nr:unnamed protein product [Lactuca virosa]
MIEPVATKILIGITLDQEQSMDLLSSAICNLARPNDTIVALHVLVAKRRKKHKDISKKEEGIEKSVGRYQMRIRKAKSFVISVMGEFANICRAKQVKLEARVGFNSSVGKGLIEEAKTISPKYLLIGSKSNESNQIHQAEKYCLHHHPKSCTLVLVRKSDVPQQDFQSGNVNVEDLSRKKSVQRSPRNVLDLSEGDYHSTEEDSSSFEGSSITESPRPQLAPELKGQFSFRKHISSLKRISSFLRYPLENDTKKPNGKLPIKEQPPPLLKCFSYVELANATNNFHQDNIVGIGGYSEVYKGDLQNGQVIAVKKLAKDNKDQNKEKEFLMELGILGHIHHPNTASLVGCCVENGLYLIFNYYPNGTLSSALHGKTKKHIKWPERYKIALGIARDLDFEPQISDFGLAKWLPTNWTQHAVIPIEGTFGYLAPEYFMHGIVDEKTDVFAFGVLLLEIITGRMPVNSDKQNLVLWAKPLMDSRDIHGLVDPDLEGAYELDEVYRLVLASSYCVQQSSDARPSMTEVLEVLQYGDDSNFTKSWRIPKYTQEGNEMDDYSMIFGYDVPQDICLDEM